MLRNFLPLQPGTSDQEHNTWNLALEIAYFGILFGLLQTFLSVYAIRLGANNLVIGMLSAMPPLILALSAIPAARLVERTQRRMRLIVLMASLHRVGALAFGLMPWLIQQLQPEAIVIIIALMTIPQAIANVAFSAMFADVVPASHRARVIAIRNTLLGLTTTLASFGGGLFLALTPGVLAPIFDPLLKFPTNYQALFIFGFCISMIGIIYLGRVRGGDPATLPTTRVAQPVIGGSFMTRLQPFFSLLHQNPIFTRYALAMFIFHWGVFQPIPLYSLYWVRNLNASDSYIGFLLAVQGISSMITYPILPRVVAQLGNRWLVGVSTILMALYPLATALTNTLEPLLFVSVLGGVGGAAFALSSFNLLLEVTPEARRPSFIAIFTTAVNSTGFIAPFLGTALLSFINIRDDLLLGGLLRFIGAVAFITMVGTKKASNVQAPQST